MRVEAPVYLTEDEEKVVEAIKNIFPKFNISSTQYEDLTILHGEGSGRELLEKLRMVIRSRRIRAAARSFMMQRIDDGILVFLLNKQAASVGKVSFCENAQETPLGAIKVTIKGEGLRDLVEWLTE
ncbi:MAG: hypothetical protein NXY59_03540 [Aigarchaeota archaeon]|nr:hypothetical protein [Candidatus Pelearchaeum maunauluense]